MRQRAWRRTSESIDGAVSRGEAAAAAARKVRDLSATVLVIGSSFMTGGASVAVLGGGSLLQGVAVWQDTGNVGSAVLQATGTFIVGVIPLGGAGTAAVRAEGETTWQAMMRESGSLVNRPGRALATTGGEGGAWGRTLALILLAAKTDAAFQGCRCLVEGNSASDALATAGTTFGIDLMTGGLGAGLDHWALPVRVRLMTDTLADVRGGAAGDQLQATLIGDSHSTTRPAASPAALPQPSSPICDANSLLSTGDCGPAEWIRQVVLQIE